MTRAELREEAVLCWMRLGVCVLLVLWSRSWWAAVGVAVGLWAGYLHGSATMRYVVSVKSGTLRFGEGER